MHCSLQQRRRPTTTRDEGPLVFQPNIAIGQMTRTKGETRLNKVEEEAIKMGKNMVAASTCIASAVMLFNPLDCYRLRWQVQTTHSTMRAHAAHIFQTEGLFRGLWIPGIGSNASGAALSRGIGMGAYPTVRDWISPEKSGITMFLAGLVSGGIGYYISTPAWVVKTRLQTGMEGSKYKGNAIRLFYEIFKQDGFRGLYRGSSALLVRGALINAGNTLGYDFVKTANHERNFVAEGPALHVIASIAAAFLSSTFCVPADFVMTKYQSGPQMGHNYKSVTDCTLRLLRSEGLLGFFRGWTPLFVRVAPLYVIYLPVYEQVRRLLGIGYLD